jgi:hypothetical protein
LDAFVCRFYVDDVETYVSPYCPVLRVLAGCLGPLSEGALVFSLGWLHRTQYIIVLKPTSALHESLVRTGSY